MVCQGAIGVITALVYCLECLLASLESVQSRLLGRTAKGASSVECGHEEATTDREY
jgi:hypothetical protein